jgi:hypothetical protein
MGGQGQSGEVRFAPHVEQIHEGWWGSGPRSVNVLLSMETILANTLSGFSDTPYTNFVPTDPETFLGDLGQLTDDRVDELALVDEDADYQRLVDNVVSKIDQNGVLDDIDTSIIAEAVRQESSEEIEEAIRIAIEMVDDDTIADLVHAFDQRSQHVRARAARRFAGTMADINAVQSSAFLFGLAIIEAEHMQAVNEFNKEVTHSTYKDTIGLHIDLYKNRLAQEISKELSVKQIRDNMLIQSVQLTSQMMFTKHDLRNTIVSLIAEIQRIRYIATTEHEGFSLDVQVKDQLWDMEVYGMAAVILGGMGGGQVIPKGPTRAGSAIGGALSGAASGAMMGSAIPGVGTAIGAGAGAVLGLGAGLLN